MDEWHNLCVPVLPNHWMYLEASWHSVQSLSRFRLCSISWIAACQAFLSITNSQSLLKPMSIESVMRSSHLILCHPLLVLSSIFPSFRIFPNEIVLCIRWPKYWSFSFSISYSNEYSGVVSFRMDWFDLLAVQGTPNYLFQHQVQKHQFFGTQLSSLSNSPTHTLMLWTVVLEKTLESPLDCKEIQQVHPKGNQSWIFIGRTDAEAETPILWPPDVKNWLIEKDPDAWKDWRQEERG